MKNVASVLELYVEIQIEKIDTNDLNKLLCCKSIKKKIPLKERKSYVNYSSWNTFKHIPINNKTSLIARVKDGVK